MVQRSVKTKRASILELMASSAGGITKRHGSPIVNTYRLDMGTKLKHSGKMQSSQHWSKSIKIIILYLFDFQLVARLITKRLTDGWPFFFLVDVRRVARLLGRRTITPLGLWNRGPAVFQD